MPASVAKSDRRLPPKASRRTALLVRKPTGLLLAVTLGGACVGLASQVGAIAGRFAGDADTTSQTARVEPILRSEDNLRAWIESRSASPSRSLMNPSDEEPVTATALPPIPAPDVDPAEAIDSHQRLVLGHDSYARVAVGALSFPDGAVSTAWSAAMDNRALHWISADAPSGGSGGVGKSGAVPTTRTPPSHLWKRMQTAVARNSLAFLDRKKASTDWHQVPTSVIRASFASGGEARAKKNAAPVDRDRTPDQRQRAMVDVGPDGLSLDAAACRSLDRVALRLRDTLRPVDIIPHANTPEEADLARQRARAVRAYLTKRGVPADRIRVQPAVQGHEEATTVVSRRVDLEYTSG